MQHLWQFLFCLWLILLLGIYCFRIYLLSPNLVLLLQLLFSSISSCYGVFKYTAAPPSTAALYLLCCFMSIWALVWWCLEALIMWSFAVAILIASGIVVVIAWLTILLNVILVWSYKAYQYVSIWKWMAFSITDQILHILIFIDQHSGLEDMWTYAVSPAVSLVSATVAVPEPSAALAIMHFCSIYCCSFIYCRVSICCPPPFVTAPPSTCSSSIFRAA